MGLALSWMAVKGAPRETVFDRLDLEDTGEAVEAYGAPASWVELPNGWLIIMVRNMSFVTAKELQAASEGGRAVGCAFEEHVMYSAAWEFRDGRQIWSIVHEPNRGGIGHLDCAGDLPAEFTGIRDKAIAEQAADSGEDARTDFIFDVPLDTARAVCGFHHVDTVDDMRWLAFTELAGRPRGLMKWLLDEI